MHFAKRLAHSAAVLALVFTGSACAQQQAAMPVAVAPVAGELATEVVIGGPALWKVADEDTTIYLFGTVHALPKDVEWYRGNLAEALASSESLVTEIYIKPGSEAEVAQAFLAKGMLPEGESVRDMLNAQDKADYEAVMTELGMPVAAFDRFEPWMAAVNLSLIPLLKAGYSPESGVEKILEQKAGGKRRGELESVQFQIGLFDGLPMATQITYMMETVRQVDEIAPMLDSMVDEWIEGDPDGLAVLMNDSFSDPVLAEALLYARNRNWAEWIDTRLEKPGTVFIAVGAGHLAGKQSVQDALAVRGIPVMRVQ